MSKKICPEEPCATKGYEEGSFACKIRHQTLLTGDAKAANDFAPKAVRSKGITSYQNP